MKIVFMVLLSVAVLPAQAAQWLPDPQRVAQAIGAQPEVQAARARVDAARAQARARAAGGAMPRKELMRRARLPRLAKAMARLEAGEGLPQN